MASSTPTQVAEGVYTLGWPMFNWFVVEDGGRLTVVDCGMPNFWDQVEPGLAKLGRSTADVEAILLTATATTWASPRSCARPAARRC